MIRRIVLPGLLGLAAYYAIFGGGYSAFELRQIRLEAEETRVALEEAREATEMLRARVDSLEHDSGTLEALARENFGLIRDGEVLYRFAD